MWNAGAELVGLKATVNAAEKATAARSEEVARLSQDIAGQTRQLQGQKEALQVELTTLAAKQKKLAEQEEVLGTAVHEERTRTAAYATVAPFTATHNVLKCSACVPF
jgi:peptidoglycan hydrolase CwlO-like protein